MNNVLAAIAAFVFAIAVMAFSLVVTTLALKYGWNLFAPQMLGLPSATGDNAFGVAVIMLTAKMFFGGVK